MGSMNPDGVLASFRRNWTAGLPQFLCVVLAKVHMPALPLHQRTGASSVQFTYVNWLTPR